MNCPGCGGERSQITDSRKHNESNYAYLIKGTIKRWRRCVDCQALYVTVEISENHLADIEKSAYKKALAEMRNYAKGLLVNGLKKISVKA